MDGPKTRPFLSSHTTGLVHSPAPNATATAPHHRQPLSKWPSPEQQQGLAALSTLNDFEISSTIDSLRSLPTFLTDQQLRAILCLRSAPDDYIKKWLDYGRRFSGSAQSERSSLISSSNDTRFSNTSRSTNNSSLSGLSSSSPHPAVLQSQTLDKLAQRSSGQEIVRPAAIIDNSRPHAVQNLPDSTLGKHESRSSTHGARHERWCTTREHNRTFTTYDGFAKHEKEHDRCYVFLPMGPIEETMWGAQCALCDELNPSQKHLQHHDILKYAGLQGEPTVRSRRGNFEELLKRHKTPNEKIKELLHKWCIVQEKKAYSCGFCIAIFTTLPERTNHIDREHFAKGQHMCDWNDTFVIKGLLLQQEVKQECLMYFYPRDPTEMETQISWPPSVVEKLRLRLELSEEAAQVLAKDVFHEASREASRRAFPPSQKNSAKNVSIMSGSSPPPNPQSLGSSFEYPYRIMNPTVNTSNNNEFMYDMADNTYEAAPISPTTEMAPNNLPFQHPTIWE